MLVNAFTLQVCVCSSAPCCLLRVLYVLYVCGGVSGQKECQAAVILLQVFAAGLWEPARAEENSAQLSH